MEIGLAYNDKCKTTHASHRVRQSQSSVTINVLYVRPYQGPIYFCTNEFYKFHYFRNYIIYSCLLKIEKNNKIIKKKKRMHVERKFGNKFIKNRF